MAATAGGIAGTLGVALGEAEPAGRSGRSVPLIDITDLYHPPQDPGDNLDMIAAYALPEVDLKAVILDVTQRYRRPYVNPDNPSYDDPQGRRD
ncbi:MAG: hypothetical protein NTU83_10275, partial [Candidatus Hydrogenedentes bacterium]|nr:hypothetical protein [Candidatus Hydrogenedentota bacterium]